MSAPAAALSLAAAAPGCPQCGNAMQALALEGHYGQAVATDLCAACHLVWFDDFESVRLSGLGWVRLLRAMQAAAVSLPAGPAATLACPRCRAALVPLHNLTRYGRFAPLECPQRHGQLQGFSLLLAQRGLVRPLARSDLAALAREQREPTCLNCGAGLVAGAERCSHCDSPLVVIDMPRLMVALLSRHGEALPAGAGERLGWPCRGCGAPVDPLQGTRCERCQHPVVVPSVVDLRPLLDAVEPLLRDALPRAARPHGEKLRRLRGDHRATGVHRALRLLLGHGGGVFGLSWGAIVGLLVLAWLLLR